MPRSSCITKKRNKHAKSQSQFLKRKHILETIENAEKYIDEDAHVEYFKNVIEEDLPELEIEKELELEIEKEPELEIEKEPELEIGKEPVVEKLPHGNCIVDLNYFTQQIRKLTVHDTLCTLGKMIFEKEIRKGIVSTLIYYCQTCKRRLEIKTHPPNNDLNKSLVWGISSIGIGFSQAEELFSIMNIPTPSRKFYNKIEKSIHANWDDLLKQQMYETAMEEKKLAIEAGHIEEGIPYITVVVDGGWAKRSYGHSYSSLSGVGCIIGQKTKKLLYLGVKNKFCYMCARGTQNHTCYKNYMGSSTGMEQQIIVEGFNRSEADYGIRYKYVIGDGDSSVYTRIIENVSYGRFVVKLECANHVTRAFTSNLYKLAKNTKYDIAGRKILKSRIPSFSGLVRTIIARCSSDIQCLRVDLKNSTRHIFGDHTNCRKEVCQKTNSIGSHLSLLESANLYAEIVKICDNVIRKADRLHQNVTTNYAERYMASVAKFTGGKRINFVHRGVYQHRCIGAGLSYNQGITFHTLSTNLHKKYLCRLVSKRKNKKIYKKIHKKKPVSQEDTEYGPHSAQPDLDPNEIKLAQDKIIMELKNVDPFTLEKSTVGQRNNINWYQARRNRITASNFGKICLRRSTTPSHNLIKEMLYKNNVDLYKKQGSAIGYGIDNETKALNQFRSLSKITVKECGIFVNPKYYFLGASPDGITENDDLVEIKCMFSIRNKKIKEAIQNQANKHLCVYLDENNVICLKPNHHYFFQIQGQLNICEKKICYLILYTDIDMEILKIERNEQFWKNMMVPKLHEFWTHCVLPELADPRIPRGLKTRNSTSFVERPTKKRKC